MLGKKITASILAGTMLLSAAPLSTFAAENDNSKTINIQTEVNNYNTVGNNVPLNVDVDGEVTTQGWKKTAVVYALRYGGDALSAILKNLSKTNANLVKKHSKQLADALDSFSNSIEARLVDYMIHTLGFPSSSARTIAWAIMLVIA
ncbi:hypothetical protein ACTHS9_30850 [Bacillus mycoides]|uniref:hypothetical protein n=1 Tax=Bacillus mycoides TaxID=1405 RepID=UPI003F7C337E